MSEPAREPVPELDAEDALRGVVNQLIIHGHSVPAIIPGSVMEALRLVAELVVHAQETGYLSRLLPAAMPWAGTLPAEAVNSLAADLTDAAASGDHAPERLAAVLREWRATAEIYADPADAERLRQARREAREGEATPWVYDDVST